MPRYENSSSRIPLRHQWGYFGETETHGEVFRRSRTLRTMTPQYAVDWDWAVYIISRQPGQDVLEYDGKKFRLLDGSMPQAIPPTRIKDSGQRPVRSMVLRTLYDLEVPPPHMFHESDPFGLVQKSKPPM